VEGLRGLSDSPCPGSHARDVPAPKLEDLGKSLRVHAAAIATVVALCGPALAQPAKPEIAVHKLRNIAAADAANTLTAFAEKKKLPVAVVAEPVSNSVMLAGDAAPIRQVAELLASLDKEPLRVVAQILVLEAPAGFAEDTGLGEGAEANWVLTPREILTFKAAIQFGKERLGVDVLSRPQLIGADNTTGVAQIGGTKFDSLTARIAPRIGSDGTVLLRVETEVKRASNGNAGEETIQATGKIADGGTLVMRGARTKTADGGARETLVIVTINLVAPGVPIAGSCSSVPPNSNLGLRN
jgi:type II secretory pathway component GspD/PulD (secretin)